MRLAYPLLWSRPGRDASRTQSVATAAALARRGLEVTLLMPRGADDPALSEADLKAYYDVEGDFRLVQRPGRRFGDPLLPSLLRLRQAFGDPEVRNSDLLYSRIPAMVAVGGRSPVPFATDHYRPWPDELPWLRPLVRTTARRRHCLGLVLHSDHAARSYRQAGVPEERILVAHNGVDPRHMLPRLDREGARRKLGLPAERPLALYAGRINGEKGLDQLLAAASLRPDVLFVLVGSEGEGPVEREAARLDNVRIVPWQAPDGLAPWLYAADLLLIPASLAPLERHRHCVLPMKLFSYLAAGRPILAPRAPDTAELLRHGDTAWLVEPDRPGLAAEAIDRLLGDSALAQRLGDNGRRLGESLSWDARAEKIHAFLRHRLDAVRSALRI